MVLAERDVRAALASGGFRVTAVHRQFVLPIALHKKIGSLGVTMAVESGLGALGCAGCSVARHDGGGAMNALSRAARASPVDIWRGGCTHAATPSGSSPGIRRVPRI